MRIAFEHLLEELNEAQKGRRMNPNVREIVSCARSAIATLDEIDRLEPLIFLVSRPRPIQQHDRNGRYRPRVTDDEPQREVTQAPAQICGIGIRRIAPLLDALRIDAQALQSALRALAKSAPLGTVDDMLHRFVRALRATAGISRRTAYDEYAGNPVWIIEHARLVDAIEKCAFAIAGTITRF